MKSVQKKTESKQKARPSALKQTPPSLSAKRLTAEGWKRLNRRKKTSKA